MQIANGSSLRSKKKVTTRLQAIIYAENAEKGINQKRLCKLKMLILIFEKIAFDEFYNLTSSIK